MLMQFSCRQYMGDSIWNFLVMNNTVFHCIVFCIIYKTSVESTSLGKWKIKYWHRHTHTHTHTRAHAHAHTHAHLTALFSGIPRWTCTRKVNQSGFYWSNRRWVAVASAGPYASLHLAPDRQPRQHPTTLFFTGQMPFLPPNQHRQSTEFNSTEGIGTDIGLWWRYIAQEGLGR